MFAFGDGLSFTSFGAFFAFRLRSVLISFVFLAEWSSFSASLSNTRPATAADLGLSVSFTVRNIGSVVGREVVQIYVLPPSTSSYRRPARELKGFVKTQLLAPGEEEVVTISLDKEAFSYWRDSNDSKRGWVAEKGVYSVAAQRSSRKEDVVQVKEVKLESTVYWRGL
jgi:beta-glucosidase